MAKNTNRNDPVSESHLELEARIRQRAHELYQQRGGEGGDAVEDWLQAEREILGEGRQPAQDRATVVGSAKTPDVVL
jgi:hypothetical protein